jgi:WD40 repeat protein
MILAGELATAESVQRFRNEAAAAAKLDHPNIVSVYEVGQHEMQHFFSMRFVGGRENVATWAKALASSPAGRAAQIAGMMAKVARAVGFAHARGVLHRDLKPSNILVDENGEPQVMDFGLAKLVDDDSGLTLSAAMLGSPSYMAPEQADARHREVTTATDVYGLGAVLYELLAGHPPFAGPSPLATAKLVLEEMPAPLPEAPRDLATICLKCLAKEPAQRYASAISLAEDLERFARGEPIRARPVTAPEALWRWARRRPKIAALLGALVLAFVLGFAGVTWQWRRAEHARVAQQKTLDHLRWQGILDQAASNDDAPRALARLAAMLRAEPQRWQAAMLAMSMVDQRAFPVLAGPLVQPPAKLVTPPRLAPDGSWFAAVGDDKIARVWETATGRERAQIPVASPATALAVSQGPLALAVATRDGSLNVRAAADAPPASLARTGTQPIDELSFSADGSRLAARSKDHIEIWKCDALDQPPLALTLEGGIKGAAISADGARVLGWNAQRAEVWSTGGQASGRSLFQMTPEENFGRGALAASGSRVALTDWDFTIRTWDVDSGAALPPVVSSLTWLHLPVLNSAGTRLTHSSSGNDLFVHDTASGLAVSPPMRHFYNPHALVVSADGTRTASFARDGRACIWDAETGRSVVSAISLDTDGNAQISLSGDGRVLLLHPAQLRDRPATVSVWRESRPRPSQRRGVAGQRAFNGCRLSPDGRLGCLGLPPDLRAYVYELATGRVLLDAPAGGDVYNHLFSPDMRRYYALTANGWLHGWDLETAAPLWPSIRQPGAIRPAEISPDGTRIIAGHNDGHIRIHDTATGTLVQTLEHPREIKSLRFAPDRSGRFVSASMDGLGHVWDLRTGEKRSTFRGHTQGILSTAWSPDSRLVATAAYDQTARVWDAATGRAVGRPLPHLGTLSHLEFSPDGRLLATACRDGTVRLWHPRTGEPASPALPQTSTAEVVRFTRDGACFLVRDHNGFRFWDTERAEPVTIHYPEPAGGGIGIDCESVRAIMTADGAQVYLAYAMNEGALWSVPQPREAVPDWFPDLLESLALMRLDGESERVISGEGIFKVMERLATAPDDEPYAAWARAILLED